MSPADQKFQAALEVFERQVGEVSQFWFAAASMNEVARRNPSTLSALNLTPSFWLTARVAMECQAILTAAKIFGPRKTNPHNIDWLFQIVRDSRTTVFSKGALEARKRQGSPNATRWLHGYMTGVRAPTAADVNRLHQLSQRHRRTYETQFADVRNLYVAHNVLVEPEAKSAVFQKTRIRDFEKLVAFLNQLHKAIWEMYYNGQRPTLRPMTHSVRSLVTKNLRDLRETPHHEHIVAETRICMALVTRAAATMSDASRRALRWSSA